MEQIAKALLEKLPGVLPGDNETKSKELVQVVTTHSGVQLHEIHLKRSATSNEKIPTTCEEQLNEFEQNNEGKRKMNQRIKMLR